MAVSFTQYKYEWFILCLASCDDFLNDCDTILIRIYKLGLNSSKIKPQNQGPFFFKIKFRLLERSCIFSQRNGFSLKNPHPLFKTDVHVDFPSKNLDVFKNGSRFLDSLGREICILQPSHTSMGENSKFSKS